MLTLIKNSVANLKGHKLRLIVAFIWIIIGITSVVFVSSVGNAMSKLFKDTFQTLAPRTVLIYYEESVDAQGSGNTSAMSSFNASDVQVISTLDGVEEVKTSDKPPQMLAGMLEETVNTDISYFNKTANTSISSVNYNKYKVIKGREINPSDEGKRVIVIPKKISDELFDEEEDPIGKAVTINNLTYEIVGVLDSDMVYDKVDKSFKPRTNFDVQSEFAPIPQEAYNQLSGKNIKSGFINNITIKVAEGKNIEQVSNEVISTLQSLHPNMSGEYKVQDQTSMQKSTEEMTKGIDQFVRIITVVAMVVGGVGIMNIMYVSVMERNKEIGIRRALGAKPKAILFQFLIESVFITACGGILGVIVGYAVTIYSKSFMPFKPIPSFNSFLYSFVAIVLTGIVFGLVPAYKASKVDPIKIIYK